MKSRRQVMMSIALAGCGLITPESASSATSRLVIWRHLIEEASRRFGIPVAWIEGVMLAESGGRTTLNGQPIRSRAGAMGLMQLMPGTWAEMRAVHGLGTDPDNPRDNILAGTAYLRAMFDRFGYPGLFGAYNAGPARFEASLRGKRLPAETQAYLQKLTRSSSLPVSGHTIFMPIEPSGSEPEPPPKPSVFVINRVDRRGGD